MQELACEPVLVINGCVQVIKKLAEFSPFLLVAPVAMVKSWAK